MRRSSRRRRPPVRPSGRRRPIRRLTRSEGKKKERKKESTRFTSPWRRHFLLRSVRGRDRIFLVLSPLERELLAPPR